MLENYEDVGQRSANYVALSPLSFLTRVERLHGARTAIVYGDQRRSGAELC